MRNQACQKQGEGKGGVGAVQWGLCSGGCVVGAVQWGLCSGGCVVGAVQWGPRPGYCKMSSYSSYDLLKTFD